MRKQSKTITIIHDVGWYHPSHTNWSYRVHCIVDDTGARLYKETFGGDTRLIRTLEAQGINVTRAHVATSAQYKMTDIRKMMDIEEYNGINYQSS